MIAVVDYGLGNVQAFLNIFQRLGVPAQPAALAADLDAASHIILPGVGAFDWAMHRLNASGMRDALDRRVLEDKVPVLGVCVGMQMMARRSEEGDAPGLGWIDGEVRRFQVTPDGRRTPLPHMGWNDVEPSNVDCLFGAMKGPHFYFLHSYVFVADVEADVLGRTQYGQRFASALRRGNVYATQFHPEKSHAWGIRLLRNFAETGPC